ncbi:MAG TPA: hypothetical protein VEG32_04750 [Clostridia bacterium]|nr:hypothetical protein [Clostridia bacterium]
MRRLPVIVLLAAAMAAPAFAQVGYKLKTRSIAELSAEQRQVVGRWCRLDYDGLRLTPGAWEKFAPLTTMKSNPEFRGIQIVSRYQVLPSDRPSMEASVAYIVIGQFELGPGFTREPGKTTVNYRLTDRDGQLMIADIEPSRPHVSRQAALAWLKQQREATTNDADRMQIDAAIQALSEPDQAAK